MPDAAQRARRRVRRARRARTSTSCSRCEPDVVVVAATARPARASSPCAALAAGAHVLVEKPAGIGVGAGRGASPTAAAARRPAGQGRASTTASTRASRARSPRRVGRYGAIMHMRAPLRARRAPRLRPRVAGRPRALGRRRADRPGHAPARPQHWLLGPAPARTRALLRTRSGTCRVEDNAVADPRRARTRAAPWAMFHVSWTEWKNLFSLEIYCRTAKLQVDGLAGSYGPQRLPSTR